MEKQFIPYELAVKLKELGFNEPCFKLYLKLLKHDWYDPRSGGNIIFNEDEKIILSDGKLGEHERNLCAAPTWMQAFDWFRKEHNLHALNSPLLNQEWSVVIDNTLNSHQVHWDKKPNYEEARSECLKKLIELVKN